MTAAQRQAVAKNVASIATALVGISVPFAVVRIRLDWRLVFLLVALIVTLIGHVGRVGGANPHRQEVQRRLEHGQAGRAHECRRRAVRHPAEHRPLRDGAAVGGTHLHIGQIHYDGLFIGETDDRVYIGEDVDPARILSVPLAQVEELFLGQDATTIPCKKKQPDGTPARLAGPPPGFRICSTVRQRISSSRGLATRIARQRAREIATFSRLREKRNSSCAGTSSPLDVAIEKKTTGASWPWNLSTVPTGTVSGRRRAQRTRPARCRARRP